jgi:molybdopterin/thiamine biosynthesis adenylyltransferase
MIESSFGDCSFERNFGLVTRDEQRRLARVCVAIPGVGGVGGWHALTLARQGVGSFRLADFDVFTPSNINRQAGAFVSTMGKPKVEVLRRMILDINPEADVKVLPAPLDATNVGAFLEDADVLLDGIDFFALDARRIAFAEARRRGIWALTAGPLGFGASMLAFAPERGPTFDQYFDFASCKTFAERLVAFAVGLAPAGLHADYLDLATVDVSRQRGPSSALACQLCGSMLALEVLALVLDWREPLAAPAYTQLDLRTQRLVTGTLRFGNRGPLQRLKRFLFGRLLRSKGVVFGALETGVGMSAGALQRSRASGVAAIEVADRREETEVKEAWRRRSLPRSLRA